MARARLLKPGFFKNEDLAALPCEARLLFAGLWTLSDREGKLEDRPRRLHVELFPYEPAIDVEALLAALAAAGFIDRYVAAGARYILIPKFLNHQSPHVREAHSDIPDPPARDGHTASPVLAQDEAEPRSPVAVPVPVAETGSVSVPIPISETETGTRFARSDSAGLERAKAIVEVARLVHRQLAGSDLESLIDHFHHSGGDRIEPRPRRQEIVDALTSTARPSPRRARS